MSLPWRKGLSIVRSAGLFFATLDAKFSSTAEWQAIIEDALLLWENASILTFTEVSDNGADFGSFGTGSQGDIRFGAHSFDGSSGTLAHGYFPPPANTDSSAGDVHLDEAENWADQSGSGATSSATQSNGGHDHGAFSNFVIGRILSHRLDPMSGLGASILIDEDINELDEKNENSDQIHGRLDDSLNRQVAHQLIPQSKFVDRVFDIYKQEPDEDGNVLLTDSKPADPDLSTK